MTFQSDISSSQRRPKPRRVLCSSAAGFTLVELLVVLVILGLIAAIAVPQVTRYISSSRAQSAKIQIERLATILDLFYLDVGRYPSDAEGLEALNTQPASAEGWAGPYLKSSDMILDPWGEPYVYRTSIGGYDLKSLGADGKEGGEGANADVTSG